ncbi:preprotein translocase subunit SecG [Pontiella agarivorans]|uniref:Protein-export membrane protein SecG n=1 Tax=Pontiella agarivorans TaxID=3038953 RepID=A0ABU5MT71_9BACT|nr:preprotein translocase subunit SecG [Pontiella agarivorans]MDZ8117411.1 preprotein translocase subunit SecG [Pontiella agarivorans]
MLVLKALLIVVLVLSCLLLIGLVLLQKSKSEGLGLAFGAGAGESLFGARAGNVLSKATVVLGIVFMGTTLALGVMFAQKDKTLMDSVKSEPVQPAAVQAAPIQGLDTGAAEAQPAAAVPQGDPSAPVAE